MPRSRSVQGRSIYSVTVVHPIRSYLDPLTAFYGSGFFATTAAQAIVNTTGRLSVGAGTHQLITIAGGTWTHTHDGVTTFNSGTATAKFLVVSGANTTNINFTGDFVSNTPASTTGILVMSGTACTASFNGNLFSSVTNTGGAILYCSAGDHSQWQGHAHGGHQHAFAVDYRGHLSLGKSKCGDRASESFTMICSRLL
jgi:hypothetical protein